MFGFGQTPPQALFAINYLGPAWRLLHVDHGVDKNDYAARLT